MGRIVIWLVGLACLALTYVAAIYYQADKIEYDLKDRAKLALKSEKIDWANVSISGRDAILEGKAPNQESIHKAKQAIMKIWGIRKVECRCLNKNPTQSLAVSPSSSAALAAQCQDKVDQQLKQNSIEFDSGSSTISKESEPLLNELIGIIKTCPESLVKIAGHTDNVGNARKNIKLSLARAESVLQYFEEMKIPTKRLKALGYGDQSPRDTNTTAEGRKRNRRIELKIAQ